ncbi:MAG: gliding motility-associated C-terminal domain-containing protein, partial [Bacteroidota bacterium]|nr:gliding motility-associated C-terminal domain-containing protein [Bacteroidota bacterium]
NTINVTCNGGNDGSINITVGGGVTPYTYVWSTTDGSGLVITDEDQIGLTAGTYDVTVTDANSAIISDSYTVTEPAAIQITSESSTNITCNGEGDGTVTMIATGGTGVLTYTLSPGGSSNTTGLFINLSADTYTVSVTDVNGCGPALSGNLLVSEPPELIITNNSSTDITCNGANDGMIIVNATGGNGTLIYTLTPGAISNNDGVFTNLSQNTYTVSVTDDNNCGPVITPEMTIIEPAQITITGSSSTNINCYGADNGSITITAAGGTGSLVYTISPGDFSNGTGEFSGLVPGIYTVGVTDANNCNSVQSSPITLTEPPAIIINSESATDITCNGRDDGTVAVGATGGSGTLVYTLLPDNISNTSGSFSNLSPNTYYVNITDANGCGPVQSNGLVVDEPDSIRIQSEISTDISCNGANDGTIIITANGGNTLSYTLIPDVTNNTGVFNNLTAGTYFVSVNDNNGCGPVYSGSLPVIEPPAIFVNNITSSNISCNGANDGTITAVATGGTGDLLYTLNPGAISNNTGLFTGLSADTYTLEVTDINNCGPVVSSNISISEPDLIVINTLNSTDISCNGLQDGTISITASGGTGAYTYTLNPGGSTNETGSFTGLSAGTYNVSITDSDGCGPIISNEAIIIEPEALSLTEIITNVSIEGGSDGAINITVTGGTGTYTFSWSTMDGSGLAPAAEDQSGLTAGTYAVLVTDANACTITADDYTVTQPGALTLTGSVTAVACYGGSDGSISVTVGGGITPYSFTWSTTDGTGLIAGAEDQSGLTAGTYDLTVLDNNGATLGDSYVVTEPDEILITSTSSTDITCYGAGNGTISISANGGTGALLFVISPGNISNGTGIFDNLLPDTYTISITDENACGPVVSSDIIISEPPELMINSETVTNLSCFEANNGTIQITASGGVGTIEYSIDNGITYFDNGGSFTDLAAGNYQLVVKDNNECEISGSTLTLTEPPSINLTNQSFTDISCFGYNNGSISLTAGGGTGELTYSIDNGTTYYNNGSFISLPANTYEILVKDANGCEISGGSILIVEPALITLNYQSITPSCPGKNEGVILVNAIGGTGDLEYILLNDQMHRLDSNLFGSFTNLDLGVYIVEISDENNCGPLSITNLVVPEGANCELKVFDAFTPNDDGANDVWNIRGILAYPECIVKVYNNWGVMVFNSPLGYPVPWDGTNNGKELPAGTYYYVIDLGNGEDMISGPVSIVR